MKKLLLTLFSCIVITSIFAQNEDSVFIRKIADEIMNNGKSYEDLRVLTKQIGARLAGSPQMVKAEQWGLKTMQSLSPDKAWMQPCIVPHWERGGKDEAFVMNPLTGKKRNSKELDVIALGNSKGSGPGGILARVIEIRSFEDLENKKDQVEGNGDR